MSVLVRRKKQIKECDCGMSIGVGNAVPAQSSGMTGAEQSSNTCIGSGDSYGFTSPVSTKSILKLRKHK